MNYPLWDVPHIGSGWVIGLIAIYHVMISHFAVGGGLYLPMAEHKAQREGRREWMEMLRQHAKFFLVLTGVFGAVSGVGIWFAIGLAQPEGTSMLIHNFVFAWAIEWVFFIVELTAAAVYYYSWGRVSDKVHLRVGWLYAFASFWTLAVINGILAFMLTPGEPWLQVAGTGHEASRFWQAFLNPTYWPNLLLRILVCTSLAGIWALVTYSRMDGDKFPQLKTDLVRWSARWVVPSFILMPVALAWYFWSMPPSQQALLNLGVSTIGPGLFTAVTRVALVAVIASATIAGVVFLFAWRDPREFRYGHALSILFLALIATSAGEYSREMLRKPYVVGRYMFSNGVRVAEVAQLNQTGYLAHSLWTGPAQANAPTLAAGQAMFRGQCMNCHTPDAYRSMKRLLAGNNREAIQAKLKMLHEYKPDSLYRVYMPALAGTPAEIDALADYLTVLVAPKPSPARTNALPATAAVAP